MSNFWSFNLLDLSPLIVTQSIKSHMLPIDGQRFFLHHASNGGNLKGEESEGSASLYIILISVHFLSFTWLLVECDVVVIVQEFPVEPSDNDDLIRA
jgi:hypothetical protein